jgi:hypothetical protein
MWSAVLAIYRLLENSSHGPEEIKRMTDAFEEALRILRLSDRLGPVSELVAARIVAIAKPAYAIRWLLLHRPSKH